MDDHDGMDVFAGHPYQSRLLASAFKRIGHRSIHNGE
jgi:hypothetical protein